MNCSRPKRVAIGKICSDRMMLSNVNYFEIFGNEEEMFDLDWHSDYNSFGAQMVVDTIAHQLHVESVILMSSKDK